jgi:hypothetical protein
MMLRRLCHTDPAICLVLNDALEDMDGVFDALGSLDDLCDPAPHLLARVGDGPLFTERTG